MLFFLLLFGIVSKIYINMGSGIFYSRIAETKENVKKRRFKKTLALAGILLCCMHFNSFATPPSFISANPATIAVCQDAPTPFDINAYLSVNEADAGHTITWSILQNPTSGTLTQPSGPSYSTTATGGVNVVPTNTFLYSPNPGVSGQDAFQVLVMNDSAQADTITILVTINELPTVTLGTFPAVCLGATTAILPFTANTGIGTIHNVFPTGTQAWTVPNGITTVNFEAFGASGAPDSRNTSAPTGKGGRVTGMISVLPNQVLNINVGGAGSGATGGYNGGGNGNCFGSVAGCGGGGGGATDIRLNGNALTDRIVVAGGGGGNGDNGLVILGGAGGGLVAQGGGLNSGGSSAGGGTQIVGGSGAVLSGWAAGSNGTLGNGGNSSIQGNSGGGGGGYYGGGGGVWSGGGGGSSFTDPTVVSLVSHDLGYNDGDGLLVIDYTVDGSYSLVWDAGASSAGFADINNDPFPTSASAFTVAIPPTAMPGTYTATLTLTSSNGPCSSVSYPITVTINDVPTIDHTTIPDLSLCNGDITSIITPALVNTTLTPTFEWTNSNIYIGLGDMGSGDLPSFTATNPGTDPLVGTISFTATTTEGCVATDSFLITVNPTPKISNTLTPNVCNLDVFNYPVSSLTSGTTFSWSRDSVAELSNASATGTDNPNEVLVNLTNNIANVNYVYTLTANGCVNTQTVTAIVNPTLILSSTHTPAALCNQSVFNYTPTSADTSSIVSFSWTRPTVPGLTNPTASGTNNPMETLENVYTDSIGVTYTYTLSANGCSNTDNVTVVVYPSGVLNSSHLVSPVCSGSLFSYTPTSLTPGATFQWNRQVQYGIANSGNTQPGGISETLNDTISSPVTVLYYYDVIVGGCSNTDTLRVAVDPAPGLTSTLNPPAQCDNMMFSYTPTSAPGASFIWIRPAVAGISNPPLSSASGVINEVLDNTSDTVKVVSYAFITSTPGGCVNSNDTVRVIVKPNPQLSSTLTPTAVCDSAGFTYLPTSTSTGATFNWSRAYVEGIANPAASGTGTIDELLQNPSNVNVDLDYVVTVSAFGCTGTPQNVHVTVKPRPRISSRLAETVCSGTPFSYIPTSFTAGTRFDWTRPSVSDVYSETSFGVGSILETLVTTIRTLPVKTVYNIRMTANGCVNNNIAHLVVTINGTPPDVQIVSSAPPGVCTHTQFQNFAATVPPPDGIRYNWEGVNASIYSVDNNRQHAIVSFVQPGTAYVQVISTVISTGCVTTNQLQFDVYDGIADNPRVVYYGGQFVCLQTDVDSYQWGYDDAATLTSNILPGEVNESYNNSNPDLAHKHYWVIVTHRGCASKSYYNAPTGVQDLHTEDVASLKLYPNPANDQINVEINSSASGKMQVEIVNMVGQQLKMVGANDNFADINVASLPAGCYLVNCYSDGVKIASSRFIKN